MKFSIAFFGRFCPTAFLGVEVVPPGLTCQNLATLGDLETLGIRLIGFHAHGKLYILLIPDQMSSSSSLDDGGHALGTLFRGVGDFIVHTHEFKHALDSFLQELLI